MYKKTLLFFVLLFCTFKQHAYDVTPWIEIKPSYFLFSDSLIRSIYGHGGLQIQGSASVPVYKYLDLYGSIGYRHVNGQALNSGEKTKLSVMLIDVGVKPVFHFYENSNYFFAIGPRFFHTHQRNNSEFVDCVVNGESVGLFVNTGCNLQLTDHLLLGLFGEYSYEKHRVFISTANVYSNGSVQMGGFAFGLSLGYAF